MAAAGWGDPARRHGLPAHALRWLHREVGRGTPSLPRPDVALPPSALPSAAHEALAAAVDDEHLLLDDASRHERAAGRSYLDLLRLRAGRLDDAPDAVVLPADADRVAA